MFIKKGILYLISFVLVFLFVLIGNNCNAEIINSIVARITTRSGKNINRHIITMRDIEIEYQIRKKINSETAETKEKLVQDMIDYHLLWVEISRTPLSNLIEESVEKIEKDKNDFKALFNTGEYESFLKKYELRDEDIEFRFKRKVMAENFLKRKAQIKKNGSNIDKNMILNNEMQKQFSSATSNYIQKLRAEADLIMVNDIIK